MHVKGPLSGSLGASFVPKDWRVRVFGTSDTIGIPYELLYIWTINLSVCMERHSHCTLWNLYIWLRCVILELRQIHGFHICLDILAAWSPSRKRVDTSRVGLLSLWCGPPIGSSKDHGYLHTKSVSRQGGIGSVQVRTHHITSPHPHHPTPPPRPIIRTKQREKL